MTVPPVAFQLYQVASELYQVAKVQIEFVAAEMYVRMTRGGVLIFDCTADRVSNLLGRWRFACATPLDHRFEVFRHFRPQKVVRFGEVSPPPTRVCNVP